MIFIHSQYDFYYCMYIILLYQYIKLIYKKNINLKKKMYWL